MKIMVFHDRVDAGQRLAKALSRYQGADAVVYGLPRGGVVVAAEVAQALQQPLDIVIARKLGHPLFPEYAVGAVTETSEPVWNEHEAAALDQRARQEVVAAERREARRRRLVYLGERQPVDVAGKTAIVVDDGLATGLTMIAAVKTLRERSPMMVVVAVPVAPDALPPELRLEVDELVILQTDPGFSAVGAYYDRFEQVDDQTVRRLLSEKA